MSGLPGNFAGNFDRESVPPAGRRTTRLLAATGEGVAILDQRGAEWEVSTTLAVAGAQCVAVDARRPELAYAGCRGGGVRRTSDGGLTWEDAGLPESDVFSVAVSAADGAVYAGCEPSRLFVADDGDSWRELEALQTIPSKPTWSFPPRPWTSHVRWIAPNPHEAGILLVGIELGGLMRSEDGGGSFSDHRAGAQRDVHALGDRLFAGLRDGRLYASPDGGDTWDELRLVGDPLPSIVALAEAGLH